MRPRPVAARAFTLVELMIVVAIIGIIAAVAVPNYVKMSCRAKQKEARSNSATIFKSALAYIHEHDNETSFDVTVNGCTGATTGDNRIGVSVKGKSRYSYFLNYVAGDYIELVVSGCRSQNAAEIWATWQCYTPSGGCAGFPMTMEFDSTTYGGVDSCR